MAQKILFSCDKFIIFKTARTCIEIKSFDHEKKHKSTHPIGSNKICHMSCTCLYGAVMENNDLLTMVRFL